MVLLVVVGLAVVATLVLQGQARRPGVHHRPISWQWAKKRIHGRVVKRCTGPTRLCAMNLFLHGIGGADLSATPPIEVKDALLQEPAEKVDLVLANPPFGKKSSITVIGEDGRASAETETITRNDFWRPPPTSS